MRMLRFVTPLLLVSASSVFAGEAQVKMGGLFRGEFMYNDNKTMEDTSVAAVRTGQKTAHTQQAFMNFTVAGSLSEKVKFDSELSFIKKGGGQPANCMNSVVKTAQATWWHGDMLSVGLGCSKHKSGGWDFGMYNEASSIRAVNPANNLNTIGTSGDTTLSYIPGFRAYNPSIEIGVHMFGDLTLQILTDDVAGNWNNSEGTNRARQTWNLEWKGDIAGIRPLVQYGMYDDAHSYHFDIGLMLDVAGFGLTADYMMVSHGFKMAKSDNSKSENKSDTGNRFSLEVSYAMKGMMTPSLYFSSYTNTLRKHSTVTDNKANTTFGQWDNNGQVIGLALAVNSLSANYSPYIAIDMISGKFLNSLGEKKTRSDLGVRLGATAHF